MSSTASSDNVSDQALVPVSNLGKPLALQELPTELVCLMAKFLVQPASQPQHITPTEGHCLRNLGGLLTATQVCWNWRASILNDAQLWTEIEITVQRSRDVEVLARVLGLSKKFPLHISIDFGGSSATNNAALNQLLDSDVSSRCTSLDLKISHTLYGRLVRSPASFPILRHSSVTPMPCPWEGRDEGRMLWDCAPVLRRLRISLLESKSSRWLHLPPSLSLPSLEIESKADTELHCTNMFFALLEKSKTLRNATFSASYPTLERWDTLGSVVNTSGSLEAILLKRDAFRILPKISLPGLKSLSIHTFKKDATRPAGNVLPSVVDFLNRSKPPLRTFTLWSSADVILDVLPSILPFMPRLRKFNLNVDMDDDHRYLTSFFDTLARNDSNGVFEVLPKLRILTIHFFAAAKRSEAAADAIIREVDRDHFVEMVRARTADPKSRLRLVEVIVRKHASGYCNLDDFALEALREYEGRLRGLKVTIQDARLLDC